MRRCLTPLRFVTETRKSSPAFQAALVSCIGQSREQVFGCITLICRFIGSVSFFKRAKLKPIVWILSGWLCILCEKSEKQAKNETPFLIQRIGKIRIFAQIMLKVTPSRARFQHIRGCINRIRCISQKNKWYENENNNNYDVLLADHRFGRV